MSNFRSAIVNFILVTALLRVQNDIFVSLGAGRSSVLLFLDLSASFHTIDHSIVLNRLKNWLGVSSTALNLQSLFLALVDLKLLLLQMSNKNIRIWYPAR